MIYKVVILLGFSVVATACGSTSDPPPTPTVSFGTTVSPQSTSESVAGATAAQGTSGSATVYSHKRPQTP